MNKRTMNDKNIYVLHARVCKALASPVRIEIIDSLNSGEKSFGELLERTGTLKSNLSQHLTVMVENGLLIQRKEGLSTFYRLSSKKVARACRMMREVLIENLNKNLNLITQYVK